MNAALIGTCYCVGLWLVARRVAKHRKLALGAWPYLTVAVSAAVSAAIVAWFPATIAPLLAASAVGAIVCATLDRRTGLIFDAVTAVMALVAATLALGAGRLGDGVIAALIVGGLLLMLYFITRCRGIGLGDVKLATALALGYGLQLAVVAIAGAFIIGAVYAGILVGRGRASRTDAMRFGPFIASGAVAAIAVNVLGYRW